MMIKITARIGGIAGLKRVQASSFSLPAGASLEEFMEALYRLHGEEVNHPSVLVAVNGRAVRKPERRSIILQDGDVVSVVRAFAGG